MLLTILDVLSKVWDLWGKLPEGPKRFIRGLKVPFVNALMTTIMLLALYGGWHVVREDSLSSGLRAAFLDSNLSVALRQQSIKAAVYQDILKKQAQNVEKLNRLLTTVLSLAPTAERLRLALFHNGINGLTGAALLRFDIVAGAAAPGRTLGPMVTNAPIGGVQAFSPQLFEGKNECVFGEVAKQPPGPGKERLQQLGVHWAATCPVKDFEGRVLGAMFLHWDENFEPPPAEIEALQKGMVKLGPQIAAALDIRSSLDLAH